MSESIVFKLTNEAFYVIIKEEMSFERLKNKLNEKFSNSEDFFNGMKIKTIVTGRDFTDEEFFEVKGIINQNTGFEDIEEEKIKFDWSESTITDKTKFYRGTLRSGSRLEFRGSIVVIGDVNPGAEIIAEDNVIVMGALRGKVHAGARGNTNAIVSAFSICPTQLRIADVITIPPEQDNPKGRYPEIAYIKEGNIYIE